MQMISAASLLSAVAISGVTAQTTGALGNAIAVTDNPIGASYIATLPGTAFDKVAFPNGNVNGSVQAVSMPDGRGVMFHIAFSNLPETGGPFIYHIHDQPVPSDGNCNSTLAHLDPYQRGELTPCDASRPETCQVGDLSGKHGHVNSTTGGAVRSFAATFTDDFASTRQGIGAFFGNRSIVLHFANTTRITCANFVPVGSCSGSTVGGGATTTTTSTTVGRSSTTTGITTGPTTRATTTPTVTTRPTTSTNGTTTRTSTATPTFVTAAAHAYTPVREFMAGAAALAFFL